MDMHLCLHIRSSHTINRLRCICLWCGTILYGDAGVLFGRIKTTSRRCPQVIIISKRRDASSMLLHSRSTRSDRMGDFCLCDSP